MRTLLVLLLCFGNSVLLFAQTINGFNLANALIEPSEIKKGGPSKDGIPALNYPKFLRANMASYMSEQDLIIGLVDGLEAKAYPIKIMNWHEVVNDSLNGKPVVITYCPLCGTGMVFSSMVQEEHLTFGVSGLLYNSDVLLYDTQTESLWSQMMSQAVNGKYRGSKLKMLPSALTTWVQWTEEHPLTTVLSDQTGFSRDYNRNPYHGYEETEQTYFPVAFTNNKVKTKERVLGIKVKNAYKAYPYSTLAKSNGIVEDNFKGLTIKISYNHTSNTAVLISPTTIESTSSYWFAWYAFHPYTKVYKP